MTTSTHSSRKNLFTLTALAAVIWATSFSANAALMTATLTGTISGGSDAYRNTVYFGPAVPNNLGGMAASISITYDTALMTNLYPNTTTYTSLHGVGPFPGFIGTVGQNPLRSASFTVNGVTVALDVSGPSEVGSLQVQNPVATQYAKDTYLLNGGDLRRSWCPNDSQCIETVGISAGGASFQDIFNTVFTPEDSYTFTAASGIALTGNVRMIDAQLCQPAGQGGLGNATGLCPPGRFDYSTSTTTHWVDFQIDGTQLSIAPTSAVPVPAAAWLFGSALLGLAGVARRRK